MEKLLDLKVGESGKITQINCFDCKKTNNCNDIPQNGKGRVENLGVRIGKNVTVLQNGSRGPLLIKVDDSRIAIGRNMAENILINS
jgi:ferrous iron transport protein A